MLRRLAFAAVGLAFFLCVSSRAAAQSAKPGVAAVRRIPLPDSLLIGEIRAAAWSEQGGIALLDARERRVIVLDPTGRVERIVGRRGSGPGEFQFPRRVGFRRDTVWVIDGGLRRITFLPREGPGGVPSFGGIPRSESRSNG